MLQFKKAIDSRYVKVKMDLLLGKEAKAFEKYLQYNTNISSNEIFGIQKVNTSKEIYDFFMKIRRKYR